MPSCFSLTKRGDTSPSNLQDVDKDICREFNAEVHPENWYQNWYNTIGLSLAIGHEWERIKEFFPEKAAIVDYLKNNYSTDSWKEYK